MTRLLVVGDTHGDVPFLEDMCRVANKNDCDRILQVGDWGYLWPGDKKDGLKSATNVLDQFGMQMFFLDGNHEWHDRLEEMGATKDAAEIVALTHNIHYLSRGLTWEWGGVTFMSLGGAYSIDQGVRTPWTSWWPTETVTYADCQRAIDAGHVDVMFTHDVPDGVEALQDFLFKTSEVMVSRYGASWNYKLDPGSRAHRKSLRAVVDEVQPDHLIHGHYHHRYQGTLVGDGYTTNVIGLDCNGGGRNSWLVLDTDELLSAKESDD